MNAAPLTPPLPAEGPSSDDPNWSVGRWIFYLLLAFGLHIGLIFVFGERQPGPLRPVKNAATLQTLTRPSEWIELNDPTIFALPHPRGFAGTTWWRRPEVTFAPFRWTEPPRLLALAVEELGASMRRYAETNALVLRPFEPTAAPLTTVLSPMEYDFTRGPAQVRGAGDLAGRTPRNAPTSLPLQPAPDGVSLTNTVVQVLVAPGGQVLSAVVIPPGSGSKGTDQSAVQLARTLRFPPVDPATPATVSRLIFEWQTLPATNGPASPP